MPTLIKIPLIVRTLTIIIDNNNNKYYISLVFSTKKGEERVTQLEQIYILQVTKTKGTFRQRIVSTTTNC